MCSLGIGVECVSRYLGVTQRNRDGLEGSWKGSQGRGKLGLPEDSAETSGKAVRRNIGSCKLSVTGLGVRLTN